VYVTEKRFSFDKRVGLVVACSTLVGIYGIHTPCIEISLDSVDYLLSIQSPSDDLRGKCNIAEQILHYPLVQSAALPLSLYQCTHSPKTKAFYPITGMTPNRRTNG